MDYKFFRGVLFALPFALAAWLLVCKLAFGLLGMANLLVVGGHGEDGD